MRGNIFDVYCETDEGKRFIVEMQNRWVPKFVNRTIYYASRAIVAQRDKASTEQNPSVYELLPVYVVCFMNFLPHKEDEVKNFKTDVMLREKNSEATFSDKLRFIYLSLPLFKKKVEECESDFDKWIYVLKHMEALERMPFTTQKKIFKRLADIADIRCLSQEDMEKYEESRKIVDDYNAGMYGSWLTGKQEGFVEGEAKGIAKGDADRGLSDAKRFLAMGLTPEQVAQGTQLPLDTVLSLLGKA